MGHLETVLRVLNSFPPTEPELFFSDILFTYDKSQQPNTKPVEIAMWCVKQIDPKDPDRPFYHEHFLINEAETKRAIEVYESLKTKFSN